LNDKEATFLRMPEFANFQHIIYSAASYTVEHYEMNRCYGFKTKILSLASQHWLEPSYVGLKIKMLALSQESGLI